MTTNNTRSTADLLILVAVLLPPRTLDILGELIEERTLDTPYGLVTPLGLRQPAEGPAVWVQPYTGLPTRTDPRATIHAARELGVRYVLNWDSGIGINPLLQRGQSAVATDFIDWTRHQPNTFGRKVLLEIGQEQQLTPATFCPHMVDLLSRSLPDAMGTVYLGCDGPRRETPAEARLFRQMGADVLGYNLVPEVYLAKELGLCYAGLLTINDHSADQIQKPAHGEVRVGLEQIVRALPDYVNLLSASPPCSCHTSPYLIETITD